VGGWVNYAAIGTGHIINLFKGLTIVTPAFDDL
jgi:hypothetical protein